jgi:hypothetical protein
MVRVTEDILEPQGKQQGLFSYLLEDVECCGHLIINCVQY